MSHTETIYDLKCTPGFWTVEMDGQSIWANKANTLCNVSTYLPDYKANAQLIAASKDLYYALKQLKIVAAETTSNLIAWDGAEPLDAAIDKAEKALNKAIGK